jgi:branched-chain amino acid transport system substrate-binding protein
VRIVSSLPDKGQYAAQSKLIMQAIDLAIDQRRERLSGWTVEHVALDGGSDETGEWSRQIERTNALSAVNDLSVIAYIGPYNSGAAKVSLPITSKAGLLHLNPTATWPGLTLAGWDQGEPGSYYPGGSHYFVRLMSHDGAQAWAAAIWGQQLAAETSYVVNDKSSYSRGMAASFTEGAASVELGVSGEGEFDAAEPNALMSKLADVNVDLVFYAPSSLEHALDFAKAIDGAGLRVKVIICDVALSGTFAQAVAASSNEWRVVYNGLNPMPDTARWSEFSATFRARWGAEPSQFAGNAYDLTNLTLDALLEVGETDRQAIGRNVKGVRDRSGVTGSITFDQNGDRLHWRMTGYRVVDGALAVEKILSNTP